METPPSDAFDVARIAAGLSHADLWVRYFGLGGMADAMQVEAIVLGLLVAAQHESDLLAHALNERFAELGRGDRLPYSDDV